MTNELSNILSSSKRSPHKIESDRGAEFYNSIFQNFMQSKKLYHYAKFIDEGPSIAERMIRARRILLKKLVFLAGYADWISELPSIIKRYINTIHSSVKMTPIQASKKSNRKIVYNNLKDDRDVPKTKI